MDDLTLLLGAGADRGAPGTCADHVQVVWEAANAALPAAAKERIETKWAQYVAEAQAQGSHLFNGPVCRLIRAHQRADGTVELHLGPCDYKSFLVTRVRDRAWFEHHAPTAAAPALGNSVLLTHADTALLGVRSQAVGVYPGRAHLIGGVLDELGAGRFPATTQGLIDHLLMELQEEAGVSLEDLVPQGDPACWPRLISLAHDEFLGQPEAFWQWEARTPLEEIARRFTPDEHDGSILLTRGGVPAEQWNVMTPVVRQAWLTWSGGRPGTF